MRINITMDITELRKYICENIIKLNNNKSNLLHDYIKENNIIHSENKNGLFINLSLCDEKHIHYFYEIITINDNIEFSNLDKIESNEMINENLIISTKAF